MELNNSYAGYTRNHSLLFIGKLRNRNSAFFSNHKHRFRILVMPRAFLKTVEIYNTLRSWNCFENPSTLVLAFARASSYTLRGSLQDVSLY